MHNPDNMDLATPSSPAFSERSFDFLEKIAANPTVEFYLAHKAEFIAHVQEPVKRLLQAVAQRLPAAMTTELETQKHLCSFMRKNDYGRGGAYDYFWGAFYPKGGRRTRDAQLFVWVNREVLRFGFYPSDLDPAPSDRLLHSLPQHRIGLTRWFARHGTELQFGGVSTESNGVPFAQIDAWFDGADPDGLRVSAPLSRERVLATPSDELFDQIARTFEAVYPIWLLASADGVDAKVKALLEGAHDTSRETSTGAGPAPADAPTEPVVTPAYPLAQLASKTGCSDEALRAWIDAIDRKGQAVFYGPPGTGKTWIARALAKHLIGGTRGFVDLVQFHPSYGYEEFMLGIRLSVPSPSAPPAFSLQPGRFLEFCARARSLPDDAPCVLILDEMNRANLSRVFGELFFLLEYREESIHLSHGESFSIPRNVRILGTMNTADRSIALVDYALRRRFAFVHVRPDLPALGRYHRDQTSFDVAPLVQVLERINAAIGDASYHLGTSFFLVRDLPMRLASIWQFEIEPYLEEFFFDRPDAVKPFRWAEIRRELGL